MVIGVPGGWARPSRGDPPTARHGHTPRSTAGSVGGLPAARITGASVAAYLVAEAPGLRYPPLLIAALTALLVVQATLSSTLTNGLQRVLSVVAGVVLAMLFVSVVGLTWWSLAALVAASIVAGQLLRLGPHLVEVPISAMLVLGVGYAAGAESAGAGRVIETVIGAVVGVLVNVLFPPPVQSRYAGQAVARFADEIAALHDEMAMQLATGPSSEYTGRVLQDARRLNRHVPRVDRALAHAEESRRLNVRALGAPRSTRSLRGGLEALEMCSVATRTLFRSVHDWVASGMPEQDERYAPRVRKAWAELLSQLAVVVRAFGELLRTEAEGLPIPAGRPIEGGPGPASAGAHAVGRGPTGRPSRAPSTVGAQRRSGCVGGQDAPGI